MPVPQGTVWALLAGGSVMSARGWEGARKSKILQIARKGRKEAGGQAQPQARAAPHSGHGRAQEAPWPPPPQLTQPESTLGGDKAKSKTSAATEKPFEALAGELTSTSPSHPRAAQPSQSSFRRAQGTRRPAARTQGTSLPCCSPQLTPEASTTVPAGRDEEETVLRVLPGPAEEQLDNPWGW